MYLCFHVEKSTQWKSMKQDDSSMDLVKLGFNLRLIYDLAYEISDVLEEKQNGTTLFAEELDSLNTIMGLVDIR